MKCLACRDRQKFWQGDDPKCSFADGIDWSGNNWNCATNGLIRDLFCYIENGNSLEGVVYQRDDDQNIGMICSRDLESDDRPLSLWVTWYKRRGRTEQMWMLFDDKPPRRPTGDELVKLAHIYMRRSEKEKPTGEG